MRGLPRLEVKASSPPTVLLQLWPRASTQLLTNAGSLICQHHQLNDFLFFLPLLSDRVGWHVEETFHGCGCDGKENYFNTNVCSKPKILAVAILYQLPCGMHMESYGRRWQGKLGCRGAWVASHPSVLRKNSWQPGVEGN